MFAPPLPLHGPKELVQYLQLNPFYFYETNCLALPWKLLFPANDIIVVKKNKTMKMQLCVHYRVYQWLVYSILDCLRNRMEPIYVPQKQLCQNSQLTLSMRKIILVLKLAQKTLDCLYSCINCICIQLIHKMDGYLQYLFLIHVIITYIIWQISKLAFKHMYSSLSKN